ncbi:MAG: hypothetical protein GY898_23035 [Proteobacteria bacterium]|nr:hypothetical protein [Pseudomonadota bacterium]
MAKKDNGNDRRMTRIEGNRVKLTRDNWDTFRAETADFLGLDLHELDPVGKGTVTIPLEVWCFLLSVLEEAVAYNEVRGARGGCQACCDRECKRLGGCDYCYGTIGVCNGGDLVLCAA